MLRRKRSSIRSIEQLGDNLDSAFRRAESIDAAAAVGSHQSTRRLNRRFAIPATAAVVLIAIVFGLIMSTDSRRIASLSTEAALAEVAKAAINTQSPGKRQFEYTRDEWVSAGGSGGGRDADGRKIAPSSFTLTSQNESWVSPTRCGASRSLITERSYLTATDRENARRTEAMAKRSLRERNQRREARGLKPLASPPIEDGKQTVMRVPPLGSMPLGRDDYSSYPTEPDAIYRRIHRRSRGSAETSARTDLARINSALMSTNSNLSPAVRAGMVQALALVPGTKSLGIEKDPLGREGFAFVHASDNMRTYILFERESGYPVLTETRLISAQKLGWGRWPAGAVMERHFVRERSITNAMPNNLRYSFGRATDGCAPPRIIGKHHAK